MLGGFDLSQMLASYTYRSMMVGAVLIGTVTGLLGSLLYLRRQSLVADVVGHSAMGGVAVSFIIAASMAGVDGRSLPILMAGASAAGLLAVWLTSFITRRTPLGSDAAMAVTLSMLFGGGMVLLRAIAHSRLPNRGGLEKIAFGNSATITAQDLTTIIVVTCVIIAAVLASWRPLVAMLFDPILAATTGQSPARINLLLVVLVTSGVVVGTKTTGLMLMIGFVMLPPAAARQWVRHPSTMAVASAVLGAFGGLAGSIIAVGLGKVPTGPVVLLILFAVFVFSVLAAPRRSILVTWLRRQSRRRQLAEEVA